MFCLPYAGGSRYSYNAYLELAPDSIEIIPLDLPGRGSRIREKPLTNVQSMVDDIFEQIKSGLAKSYVIYGHSMGSLIGYLLVKKILAAKLNPPLHLFVTGRGGPSTKRNEPPYYLLPYDEFIQKLREMQGSPTQILDDPDSMEFFEPIIRADFQCVETYNYEKNEPFNIPITCMFGSDEDVKYEEALTWQLETTATLTVKEFPGEHFFIFNYGKEIMEIISSTINGNG